MNKMELGVSLFLENGFNLKGHLQKFLQINCDQLDQRLMNGLDQLAAIHPGAFNEKDLNDFYEDKVGDAHLLDLASWHLNSADYIADTLRLQEMFARGKVLDFGGGIGTHALAATSLKDVEHVYFVDLNPQNRDFVAERAKELGVEDLISFHRDLENISSKKFDTVICLDVLEHLPDPSEQISTFLDYLNPEGIAIMNWYFYKGKDGEYPFHFDDEQMIERFFTTLQNKFIEVFHPFLITTRAYKPNIK